MVVSNICYFHPYLGKIPILTSIFFKGVGSTTNQFLMDSCLKGACHQDDGGSGNPAVKTASMGLTETGHPSGRG